MVQLDYPKHGNRNILKRRIGEIVAIGREWITLKLRKGLYRTFSASRICNLHILEAA